MFFESLCFPPLLIQSLPAPQVLLGQAPELLGTINARGETPLHRAVCMNAVRCCNALLARGQAALSSKDMGCWGPSAACQWGFGGGRRWSKLKRLIYFLVSCCCCFFLISPSFFLFLMETDFDFLIFDCLICPLFLKFFLSPNFKLKF